MQCENLGLALMFLVIKARKQRSTEDIVNEEAAIERVGLRKRQVATIVAVILAIIVFAMMLRLKKLAWFLLLGVNVLLLLHLMHLRYRKDGTVEMGGYRIYGDN